MGTELLKSRRSVRVYKEEQISDKELDAILEAGTYAPTGMNGQTPVIVAVQNAGLIARLEEENAKVMGRPGTHPFYGAPTVVVVFADKTFPTGFEDACLVLGNLLNAAAAVGVGSCWIHRAREVFASPFGRELMEKWGLDPDKYVGVGNCILGYAKEVPPAKPRKQGYVVKVK